MKKIIFLVFSISLLSLGGWLTVLGNVNPYEAPHWERWLFFSFLFLLICGTSTLINYFIRIKLTNRELVYVPFKIALRQSLLLSFTTVGLLILWVLEVLNWLSAGVFVLLMISVEFYFQNRAVNISPHLQK